MSKPPSVRWNAYWPKSTLDLLDAMAAERGMTRKEVVIVAVRVMQALEPPKSDAVSGLTEERESK